MEFQIKQNHHLLIYPISKIYLKKIILQNGLVLYLTCQGMKHIYIYILLYIFNFNLIIFNVYIYMIIKKIMIIKSKRSIILL